MSPLSFPSALPLVQSLPPHRGFVRRPTLTCRRDAA